MMMSTYSIFDILPPPFPSSGEHSTHCCRGKYHSKHGLQFDWSGFDSFTTYLGTNNNIFSCWVAPNPVKLETIRAVQ